MFTNVSELTENDSLAFSAVYIWPSRPAIHSLDVRATIMFLE